MFNVFLSLRGRLGRLAYFGYSICLVFIVVVVGVIATLALQSNSGVGTVIGLVFVVAVGITIIWGSIAIAVKRLHDINMSGWHYLWMALVPSVINGLADSEHSSALRALGGVLSLGVWGFLLFMPGTPGPNRFG